MRSGSGVKPWFVLLALCVALTIKGCSFANITSNTSPQPLVAALPVPKLPDWIEQISPLGDAATTAQIRIRFKEPIIPLENLENGSQELLKKFEVVPPLPGTFRFLTPRMVGFQGDQAIPKATRVQVKLKAGLADLKNHRLDQDLAWTFNTEAIKLSNLPGMSVPGEAAEAARPLDLKPVLKFTSNVELNLASLKERVKLVPANEPKANKGVTMNAALEKSEEQSKEQYPESTPDAQFDPSARDWIYTLEPQQALAKATRYRLEITPGLAAAKGNLASESMFASQVETYAPLAFQKLNYYGQPDAGGTTGRFVNGSGQLEFNNELDAEAAIANISVEPPPKKDVPLVRVYEGERLVNLNPWALEPATKYTIKLGADLKDKFGQTLGKPMTVDYQTGDVGADLWAPSGLNIFPTGKNLQLNLSTVNLPSYKAAFAIVQPTDLVYTDSAYPNANGGSLLPSPSAWKRASLKGQKNQAIDTTIPLQQQLGSTTGMLAYGVQARTNQYQDGKQQKWREPTTYGLVQLTNLGVFAQWFPESGMVRVSHLSDGSAVANAAVQVYQSKLEAKDQPTPSACATGKTDKTGTLLLDRSTLQTCMGGAGRFANAPNLLVVAQEGKDWAFTRTTEYSGAYGYGIDAGWQGSAPESRGVVFSDRNLYQPGETAWFTGAAYYLQNGALKQDKNARYTLTLRDSNGQETSLGTQTTNEFGTFSKEWTVAKNQPLGYYAILAKNDRGVEITGEFRVAEFKPPNFKVALTLEGSKPVEPSNATQNSPAETQNFDAIATVGQTITAKTQSNYLFGSPVEGGKVNYYVTRKQAEFVPKGWDGFAFGRQWFWPEEAPTVTSDVLQTNQVLSQNGDSSQTVTVEKELPYPMAYRVDAQVSDVSNLSVSDSKTFLALPTDKFIGLQSDFVATAGQDFPVKVIVTDPAGAPVLNQKVHLELQQMNYSRVSKLVEGSRTQQDQVEYKTVATADIQSDVSPKGATLKPTTAGAYRLQATFAGSNVVSATEVQLWATGDAAAWGNRYRNNRLEIKLDKKQYQVGETATALIQSPYADGELYFAVVRHNTLYKTLTKVQGGAPKVQFQVTPEMLPNAAIEAVLVRQGKPLEQVEPGSLDQLVRIGFAPFETSLAPQYLKVEATVAPSLQPGDEQTVQVRVSAQDQPAKGQVTLMVVNEAVLQLTGYRPPDLVKTVYAEQPVSVRLSDNRPDVVLQPQASPLQKGWGYGGGSSAGAGNTRIRTNFKALAYYNGSVKTDAIGNAIVKFKLPDDLTTWRVMAVATDENMHFGNGDATFVTTKPLLANPLLPQFARPGDRFQAGVSVTNNTGQNGNLSVNGTVTEPLKLDNSGQQQAQVEAGTKAYRFPVVVQSAGEAMVKFTTQLGSATDVFELPLDVKPLDVTEQVVEAGTTTDRATIPLNVDKNVAPDAGGLDISLASSLIPTLVAPARQVLDETNLPFLEPAASQLAIAANLQTLTQTYGQTFASFNPTQQATQALDRLQTLQKPDGGFAAYPGQETSDPFITPHAAQAIALADRAFSKTDSSPLTPSPSLLSPLTAYLKKLLADPGQYDFCKQALCKNQVRLETLIALADLGDRRNDFLADLYSQRSQFDPVSQIKLARYLSQFPDWQQEATTMVNQLQETIYQTGRNATVNLPSNWRWLNSPTTAQAQALRLFVAQKAKAEDTDRLLQGLLSQRRNGTWQSTHDNAEALTALVAYSQLQPTPPTFEATAALAGKPIATAKFSGYRTPSTTEKVEMAALPRDRNDLILTKTGQGTLHYLVAYRYRLQGNQPGKLNGLRITRTIRPANEDKVVYKTGLYAPEPLTVPVGQVYDIGLEIIADHSVDHVVVTDPLPAGFEAVDDSFQTTTPYFQSQGDSWQLAYQTIYHDRVVAFGDKLDPGVYTLHYLVRSVTPGTFVYPGAEAHLQYAPEEFGRSASSSLVVTEK
ncbi:alpha-2-macroglobulin family protein [Leptolyngbya sp. FACHB-321]|uniref:alpha-2-macroglobulin family protein n=1 Tax=Leptolyngbya sp. FACHB-321 TaxID=2692807 RepID=UPI001682C0F6|nr:alpha-2-macroglobulin [Leptolyngbya sp. FACHB-321]MBD2037584.1 alpha-2-macroglobulin family protein [Leptolyngbya sp. FACHB-321]